uniref:Class I SAM-dependent RNA methyltransferase n=1 Tax=candidate division WOR-3 bacterium TaxID=2052148 RepID=A0A7C4U8B0_UNCW3
MREELKIEKVIYGGYGLSRKNGFVYLIPFTAKGDKVIAECERKKDYYLCKIVEIKEPSPSREKPVCSHFGICGGCHFQHINREEELSIKKEIVEENLLRIGRLKKSVDEIIGLQRFHYRNKLEYNIIDGDFSFNDINNEKLKIEECFIEEEIIKDYRERKKFQRIEKIIIRCDNQGNIISTGVDRNFKRFIIEKKNNKLRYKFKDVEFEVSPFSFFQTNTMITEKMIEKVKELLKVEKEDVILDGYGGVGTFGISISGFAKKIFIIEKGKNEVIDATNNLVLNRCDNVKVINIDIDESEEYLKLSNKIILDPPREGISKIFCEKLNRYNIEKIIYISCNPATLARDLGRLNNYDIEKIIIFDMFPMSYHIETMVLLRNAPGGT